MKKYLFIASISFLLFSCSGGGSSTPTPPPPVVKNTAPTVPVLTAPINSKLCVDNLVNFQWNASVDAESDAVTYQIQVARDNQFLQIVSTIDGAAISQNISLDKGLSYYWRVKATDSKSLSSEFSSVYSFYTAGVAVTNYLPFSPALVQPALGAILNTATATLKWTASDVDVNDKLVCDVYFGTTNPPTAIVSASNATNSYNVNVVASTEYFWKIVVKDGKGGETIGQIWKFKTN
jgi:hypothetical protein